MNLPSLPELRAIVRSLGLPALRGIQHIDRQWSVERHRLSFEGGQQEVILARQLWHTGLRPLDAEAAAIRALIAEDFPAASGMQLLPDGAMDRPATLRVHTPGSPNTHGPSALSMYGDSIARLFDIPLPQWGTRAGQG